jgi:hypothetical protein
VAESISTESDRAIVPDSLTGPDPGKLIGSSPFDRYVSLAVVVLVILLCSLVRLRLMSVPLERDEGEYAYAGQLILKGIPPYIYAYSMKLPGTYCVYALVMALFGQSPTGIHLGLLIVNACTVILIFLLSRRLLGSYPAAASSALSYGVLSLGQPVLGVFFHATNLVVLFATAGLLTLLNAIENGRKLTFFWSGLLLGLAVLMKQHGAFFLLFACLYTISIGARGNRVSWWRAVIPQCLSLFAGVGVPMVVTLLVIVRAGVFTRFWFWTVRYASAYEREIYLSSGVADFLATFGPIARQSIPLWILASVGIVALFWRNESKTARVFVAGLAIFSFFALSAGFQFRRHYFILILPAAALLVGLGVKFIGELIFKAGWPTGSRVAQGALLMIALVVCLIVQRTFLFRVDAAEASRFVYGPSPFPESVEVAKYIRSHCGPTDTIAVMGSEPQIYFYSHRLGATGYIYMYELTKTHPFALRMQEDMVKQIESARPSLLVYVSIDNSWLRTDMSESRIFDWMGQYVPENYELTGLAQILAPDLTRYYWDDPRLAGYQWNDGAGHLLWPGVRTIMVFRRKSGPTV